ncbi:MAG: imidazole glycerol phosphate synthase cyclase subunit [Kangiellaceae bacterium]|nr:imidazole glycerol phosphate synthase cyclase subunit [Kangiellaceae bacterium]
MKNVRLIPRLDVKGPNLIKGVHLEGLRVIGDPQEHAVKYYLDGADEIIYMDVVASLYGRNNLTNIVEHTANNVFIPITVGGGVRSVEDARKLLRSGADKVAINTAAIERPELLSEIADVFGTQCVVLSVEAKYKEDGTWEAYTDNGREKSGRNVLEWVELAAKHGAGEILLTSIDHEGTSKGFELNLVKAVSEIINVPIIASGGMGKVEDAIQVIDSGADAVAMADILHYKKMTMKEIHDEVRNAGLHVRRI